MKIFGYIFMIGLKLSIYEMIFLCLHLISVFQYYPLWLLNLYLMYIYYWFFNYLSVFKAILRFADFFAQFLFICTYNIFYLHYLEICFLLNFFMPIHSFLFIFLIFLLFKIQTLVFQYFLNNFWYQFYFYNNSQFNLNLRVTFETTFSLFHYL